MRGSLNAQTSPVCCVSFPGGFFFSPPDTAIGLSLSRCRSRTKLTRQLLQTVPPDGGAAQAQTARAEVPANIMANINHKHTNQPNQSNRNHQQGQPTVSQREISDYSVDVVRLVVIFLWPFFLSLLLCLYCATTIAVVVVVCCHSISIRISHQPPSLSFCVSLFTAFPIRFVCMGNFSFALTEPCEISFN